MIVIASLEHIGHGVGDIVNGGTRQSLRIQHVDGFVQLAARIFEVRCWTAHNGNEALEQVREGVARPGHGHRHRETPHLPQAGGSLGEAMVLGVERQDGHDLPATQGDAEIDQPDEAIGKRRLAQG